MIQRVQSVFFFIAALDILCLFFFPTLNNQGVTETALANNPIFIGAVTCATLFFAAIFLFKNRALQANVGRLGLLLALLLIAVILYYENADGSFDIQWGAFLPLCAIIIGYLGIRYVNKDEKLVRDTDRLR